MARRPAPPPTPAAPTRQDLIAIVGFGGVFPAAPTLDAFWRILERGVDTSRPVPPGRWVLNPQDILEPGAGLPDRVYTDRGCFVEDFHLDPSGLSLPLELVEALDPSVHLLLEAGRSAWAGIRHESLDRRRVGVVVGNIALPTAASSALGTELLTRQTVGAARALNRHVVGLPAGVLAQALQLGGGSAALDAACASSLYAVKLACDALQRRRADAMLAGGLSRPDSLYTQMGFCQLRALARGGRCAPFDAAASGLIVGEGAGIVVLKRLADALCDGDRIHAIIRGIGLSNDLDGNLLSPSPEGQLRALRQAYRAAEWSPGLVDLIECHATGTPVGDAVEFESLCRLWQDGPWNPGQCVLGAVKANIGHLLTAAGAASLIKVLLALAHATLPATANFRQPAGTIPLAGSPFRILTESAPWRRRDATTPRRAAINGFGFGGINAHLLLEEWIDPAAERKTGPAVTPAGHTAGEGAERSPDHAMPIAIVGIGAHVGRWPTLRAFQERVLGGRTQDQPVPGRAGHAGYFLEDLAIPVNRYRIPPRELADLLPQQALMLETARAALADAETAPVPPERRGVFVGLGLDLRTTDYHHRWAALAQGRESGGPPLTADRTMGALAGTSASRIAKEFHCGGPSHTVCCEECSGTKALEIAVRALQAGELDQALAGAVDLTGDLRALRARGAVRPFSPGGATRPFDAEGDGDLPGEGAVAVVLKRLADARRDGDRIYAIVRGIGSAGGGGIGGPLGVPQAGGEATRDAARRAYVEAAIDPATVGYLETLGLAHPEADREELAALEALLGSGERRTPCWLGSAHADVGDTGAAASLVAVVKAALALYQEILPPLRGLQQPLPELAGSRALRAPLVPQLWLRNRADGPRRAGVGVASTDGNCMHVVLEGCEDQAGGRSDAERIDPLGEWPEALFTLAADDRAGLVAQARALRDLAAADPATPMESLARTWWRRSDGRATAPSSHQRLAVVAQDSAQLTRLLDQAADALTRGELAGRNGLGWTQDRDRLFFTPPERRIDGGLAFVFPGVGNTFPDMGRDLALRWPDILRAQDRENQYLAAQMCADRFWDTPASAIGTDHRAAICGQVTLGTMLSDLAQSFGLRPDAVLGYSLGESTGLFALRAWTARDEMWRRVSRSTLFARDLTGAPESLRRAWRLPDGQPVEWQAGLVDRPAAEVRAAIAGRPRIYVLIVNTPEECVVGGEAAEVQGLLARLQCHWIPLDGVSTVHCELLTPVEQAYRELHRFDTSAPPGVRFYSGGWGRPFTPDTETAAEAIVAQARDCVDFPRVVHAAYDAGIRFFLEMGPGNSCSRMIGRILEGRPHVARSLCASAQESLLSVLRVLGQWFAEGREVDLARVYAASGRAETASPPHVPSVRIPIASPLLAAPTAPAPARSFLPDAEPVRVPVGPSGAETAGAGEPGASAVEPPGVPFEGEFLRGLERSQAAALTAHQAYLDFSRGLFDTLAANVQSQLGLLAAGAASPAVAHAETCPPDRAVALDREACLEFARGSLAAVLGEEFRPVDGFPTRVRLPDEPLMLVDRILEIQGEPRSMSRGRVVTEHEIHPGAWYLDGGRIPACIAVEAGQADLFLSGYLGIDFATRGNAVYRLLDAKVRFHRSLPGPGKTIRYDINIEHFFRQAGTWLFRFNFEATVDGEPLLTMTDGCAGFFTAQELAEGRGVVQTALDREPRPGVRGPEGEPLVPVGVESYSAAQLDALRAGDFAACFGPAFADLSLRRPMTLPGGRMTLVHRIPLLDPTGGRYGLGLVRGEADIRPDDWFLTCHFVDDRVMPGTLMYECCLHTLRVFLLRWGWVAEQETAGLEPVPGVVSQLKCRGQVLETTALVTYEVAIKEMGCGPEPYAIADALMYADGRLIVEVTNLSLRYAGATAASLRATWRARRMPESPRALFGPKHILALAIGKPSEAFGEPYRVFDEARRIARLPGPPYLFLDRIVEVAGEPFKMMPGGVAVAEYDVPPDAWYFAANRQDVMPFAVLLEVALQPCGWLAAYVGSALTSASDLFFRNLGGAGTQCALVPQAIGTLTTRVTMTRVSSSAGMIIQGFDFEVRAGTCPVYRGDTYFGFFPEAALAQQEGLRDAAPFQPAPAELARARSLPYPGHAPFPDDRFRMVDHLEVFLPDGGPQGLGFLRGTTRVQPDAWFFKAHFYQDPVVPGSLGLESLLQLLKVAALDRWGQAPEAGFQTVAVGAPHQWVYRGQVVPTNALVTVEAVITGVDDAAERLTADGFLSVDGRVIYGMKNFTVQRSVGSAVARSGLECER